jgi:hypothetical protein
MGVKLKARGGQKQEEGKSKSIFQSLAKARQWGIYTQQVSYIGGSNLNKTVTRNI